MAEGPLDWCELPVGTSKLIKYHVCEVYHDPADNLPGKQKVPGSNPGGTA